MAFDVRVDGATVVVALRGWDRIMNWRRSFMLRPTDIRSVSVVDRAELESLIDHRAMGWGTHNGAKRPGRRRIGTMLGRSVAGKQFWAVPSGPGSERLLVLDLRGHDSPRAVLAVADPEAAAIVIDHALATS